MPRIPKHVRMAPHQLFIQAFDDVGKFERPLLLRHAGVEDHLQQEIAQLLTQIGEVSARNGVGDLVGFLDGIGGDARKILLQNPMGIR